MQWPTDIELPPLWAQETAGELRSTLHVLVYRPSLEESGACHRERYEAGSTLPHGLLEDLSREAGWPQHTVLVRAYFEGESAKDLLNKRFASKLPPTDPAERFLTKVLDHQDELFNIANGFFVGMSKWGTVIDKFAYRVGKSAARGFRDELDL